MKITKEQAQKLKAAFADSRKSLALPKPTTQPVEQTEYIEYSLADLKDFIAKAEQDNGPNSNIFIYFGIYKPDDFNGERPEYDNRLTIFFADQKLTDPGEGVLLTEGGGNYANRGCLNPPGC